MIYSGNNPEFLQVTTDNEGRIIDCINQDGTKSFKVGMESDKINIGGNEYYVSENPEWIRVITDNENRVIAGIRNNGATYIAELEGIDIDSIKQEIRDYLEEITQNIKELNNTFEFINDPESRNEITLDAASKIISCRKDDGTLVENVGIETNKLILTDDGMNDFQKALKNSGFQPGGMGDFSEKSYIHIPTTPKCAIVNISGIDSMPMGKNVNYHAWMEVYDGNGNFFKKKILLNDQGNSSRAMAKHNFAVDFCEDEWIGDDTTSIKIGNWVTQDSFHFKAYYTSITKGECPICYKLYDKFMQTKNFSERAPYMEYYVSDYNASNSGSDDIEQNMEVSARCYPDGFPCIVFLNGDFYGIFSWQLKKHRDNFHMDRNATDNIHLDGNLYDWAIWGGNVDWTNFEVRNPKPKKSKWNLLCQDGSKYDGDNPRELMGTDSEFYDATDTSCKKSAQTKENIVALSHYMEEINTLEIISTNNGDIAIRSYGGNYNDTSNFGKGVYVKDGSSYYMSLHSTNAGNPTSDTYYWMDITENISSIRNEIEKRFAIDWLIDYVILITIVQDGDSIAKNWQWTTWGKIDGKMKWFVNPYDMDGAFGVDATHAFGFSTPNKNLIGGGSSVPARYPWLYYMDEIKERYYELRNKNVISYDSMFDLFLDWVSAVGIDNYKSEIKKWSDTPSCRENYINSDWEYTGVSFRTYWDTVSTFNQNTSYSQGDMVKYGYRCYKSKTNNNIGNIPNENPDYWDDVKVKPGVYNSGDLIYDGYTNYYQFRVKEGKTITVTSDEQYTDRIYDNLVNAPFSKLYPTYPHEGGVYDSIYRISNWIKVKIELIDNALSYINNN